MGFNIQFSESLEKEMLLMYIIFWTENPTLRFFKITETLSIYHLAHFMNNIKLTGNNTSI